MEIDIDLTKTKIRIKYLGRDEFIRVQPYSFKNHAFIIKAEVGSVTKLNALLPGGIHPEEERFILDLLQTLYNYIEGRGA